MPELPILLKSLLHVIGFMALFYTMYRLVRFAREKSRGAYTIGSVFMIFGLGNVRDPGNEMIQQAREGRHDEDDDSGEPPGPGSLIRP